MAIAVEVAATAVVMAVVAVLVAVLVAVVVAVIYIYICKWTLDALRTKLEKSVMVPILGGSLFFVISSVTNPYILSVERLLILFIPYLLISVSRYTGSIGVLTSKAKSN